MVARAKVSKKSVKMFQDAILACYKAQGRDLPWRCTTHPYEVLVSELMLQQTQVDRVIPKYLAFLEWFPTPQTLVDASLTDVLRMWQGLGYNRRAKYLKHAAHVFLEHSKPSYEQLVAQKGIGPYTAAAVCAFAYNQDIAAIDVNIRRVFNRFFGDVDDTFIANVVPAGKSRDWHNALMDFGATLCTKRAPSCESCPLRASCHALANDTFRDEPARSQKKFEGSVRWHRGQVLKMHLSGVENVGAQWSKLDEKLRDKKKFILAREQLRSEELIN